MKSISHKVFFIVTIFILLLTGCHKSIDRNLATADAMMDSDPATALMILDSMSKDGMDRERGMLYDLLKEKAMIKQHKNIESVDSAKAIMEFYNGRRDSLGVLSKLYYGKALRQHGRYEEAIVPLTFAYDVAMKLNEDKSAGMAAGELTFINGKLFIYTEQLSWAEREVENFQNGQLPLHEAWAQLDLIEALARNNKIDEAVSLVNYLDSIRPDDNPNFLSMLNFYRPWLAYLQDKPEEAVKLYEEAIESGRRPGANIWYIIGKSYLRIGNREKAVMALEKIRPAANNALDSIWALDLEARIATADNDYRKAYEKAADFGKSMMNEDDKRISQPATILLIDALRENYKLAQEINAKEHQEKRLLIVVGAMVAVFFVVVLLWIVSQLRAKRRENKLIGLEVATLRSDVESLNEKATMKEREAVEKIRSLLKERLKPLNGLYEACFRSPDMNSSSKGGLVKELDKLRSEESVADLERTINEYCNDWMKRFRDTFPDLPKEHYSFVIYLYIGLSNEAIAILLNKKSLNTVYGVKARLKEKLAQNDSVEAASIRSDLGLD